MFLFFRHLIDESRCTGKLRRLCLEERIARQLRLNFSQLHKPVIILLATRIDAVIICLEFVVSLGENTYRLRALCSVRAVDLPILDVPHKRGLTDTKSAGIKRLRHLPAPILALPIKKRSTLFPVICPGLMKRPTKTKPEGGKRQHENLWRQVMTHKNDYRAHTPAFQSSSQSRLYHI